MTARDTPNFIGNRIALFEAVQVLRAVERGDVTIDETDAITGPAIGRPKSATFRTMDIAGDRRHRGRGQQPPRAAFRR